MAAGWHEDFEDEATPPELLEQDFDFVDEDDPDFEDDTTLEDECDDTTVEDDCLEFDDELPEDEYPF